MRDITQLLNSITPEDPGANRELVASVYNELRGMARAKMAKEPSGHTLQPTALVHEAWLRLGADQGQVWDNRAHFFGAAAEAMRRILVDRARKRLAMKHGGGMERVDADEVEIAAPGKKDDDVIAISDALERFSAEEPEKAELVKLRYFVGMTLEEAGEAMGVSTRTAKRWWAYARAWLKAETGR